MTTSLEPWTITADGTIKDRLGNPIGFFKDPRDAELVVTHNEKVMELENKLSEAEDKITEIGYAYSNK